MVNMKNKVVVVTGGAKGIGWGIARRSAERGAKVVVADIDEKALADCTAYFKEHGIDGLALKMDVMKDADFAMLRDKTLEKYGSVDYLFSNVGIYLIKTWDQITMKDWEWNFNANVFSNIRAMMTFIPVMEKQPEGGKIVVTASAAAIAPMTDTAVYAVTKVAVQRLTECAQLECKLAGGGKEKISFACILPGSIKTTISVDSNSDIYRPAEYANNIPAEEERSARSLAIIDAVRTGADDRQRRKIPIDTAVASIFEQMDLGYFYIYTHEQASKAGIYEQAGRMLKQWMPIAGLGDAAGGFGEFGQWDMKREDAEAAAKV